MAISTLSPMHLSNNKTYEVQRTNNFEVQIDGLSQRVTLAVQSCPLPTVSNDPIELSFGNSKVKVAGQASYEDVELTVLDLIGADIEKVLSEWRKQVYDPETDKIGFAEDYKRNGKIYQYAPDGSHVRTWKIIGAWPTNLNPGDMNYEGSDKKVISMTLSIDKAYIIR